MKQKLLTLLLALILAISGCAVAPLTPELPPEASAIPTDTQVPSPLPTPEPPHEEAPVLPEPEATQYLEPQKDKLPKELAKLPLPDKARLMSAMQFLTASDRMLGSENERAAAEMIKTELVRMGYSLDVNEFDQNTFAAAPLVCQIEIEGTTYKLTFASGPSNDRTSGKLVYWDLSLPLPASIKGAIAVTDTPANARLLMGGTGQQPAYIIIERGSGDFECPTLLAEGEAAERIVSAARQGKMADITIQAGLQEYSSCNIQAFEPENAGKPVIIVSAHYDSVFGSPGALDNACGVASLLEIARLYKGTESGYDVRFSFFSGEEYVMIGSKAYLLTLNHAQRENIKGVINLDMFGSPKSVIYAATRNGKNNQLTQVFFEWRGKYFNDHLLLNKVDVSDHETFDLAGIPAMIITQDALQGVYHSANDTTDKVEPQNLVDVCTWVLAYLLNV